MDYDKLLRTVVIESLRSPTPDKLEAVARLVRLSEDMSRETRKIDSTLREAHATSAEIKFSADRIADKFEHRIENWLSQNRLVFEGIGGALAGGLVGGALAGPVGGVIGSYTGSKLGDKAWKAGRKYTGYDDDEVD